MISGQPVDVSTIVKFDNFGQYLLAALLMGVGTAVGFMLCVIPGIIVFFLGVFFPYFIIDKGMGAIDAIKASIDLVRNNVGQVVILVLLTYVANFIGQLLCGVGLLASVPVVAIATAYLYKRLLNEPVAA